MAEAVATNDMPKHSVGEKMFPFALTMNPICFVYQ